MSDSCSSIHGILDQGLYHKISGENKINSMTGKMVQNKNKMCSVCYCSKNSTNDSITEVSDQKAYVYLKSIVNSLNIT